MNVLVQFPLRVIIPLSLVLFTGLIVGLLAVNNLRQSDREVEQEIQERVVQLMTRTQGTMRNLSRKQDAGGLQLEVSQLGSDPLMRMAALIGQDNRVLYATRYALIGKELPAVFPDLQRGALEEARRRQVGNVVLDDTASTYLAYYPVELWDGGSELRGVPLGMVVVSYDVASPRLNARNQITQQITQFGLAIGVFSVLLWLMFHYGLTRRVDRLVASAKRFGEGDLEARVNLSGRDELAEVGSAFDDMVRLIAEDQAHLADSESRVRAVLDNVTDGIVTTNEQGMIQSANPALQNILGCEAVTVVGRHLGILFTDRFARIQDQYLVASRKGVAAAEWRAREVTGACGDGRQVPLEVSVADFQLAGERLFVWIIRDITERKKVDRMKNEFVSVVSHELRTPLTSIMGSLGLLTGGVTGDLPEQARQMLEIARSNSERLVRLINDILDIEKIESGSMDFQEEVLDLGNVIRQAIEANRGYAVRCSVRFELEEPPLGLQVRGDADRLVQVLGNLLSNAAKYSPENGVVHIRMHRDGESLRVVVRDQGPGVPPDFHERIFDKFAQADSTDTRLKDGTGLGLSIAKSIVEHHGGEMGFTGPPDGGTEFYFCLPEWRASHSQAS